jgi:hypothetical protein
VATLALFFAMSGGALAAKHYLINSTKQISPRVLKALKGNAGPVGRPGPPGASGALGKEGAAGKEGQRGPSNGYQAFKDAVGALNPSEEEEQIGSLPVPAGSYLATAKLWVLNSGAERAPAFCKLVNDENGDGDTSGVTVEPKGATGFFGRAMVTLEAASTLPSAGHWVVRCDAIGKGVTASNLKIHAIQVANLVDVGA